MLKDFTPVSITSETIYYRDNQYLRLCIIHNLNDIDFTSDEKIAALAR